ncbi:transposase-like protein [Paraburkholderia sp. GAS448]|jgi:transposase
MAAGEPSDRSVDGFERRRRWSTDEKLAMVQESFEPDGTVSMVARQQDVNPNQLFTDASFTRTAACRL